MSKKGVLYGVGVGPGDPELMTLKAVRIIKECDVIMLPAKNKEDCYAYQIAAEAVPEIVKKQIMCTDFPMIKDRILLEQAFCGIYEKLEMLLSEGKKVAFLTIGDPSIYSTYMAMHERAKRNFYEAIMISGVPSFCAAAARLSIPLGERAEQIHIVPASYDTEEMSAGTRIYMKSGAKLVQLKERLYEEQKRHPISVYSVSNCGMENEAVAYGIENLSSDNGYLTIVIVKEML